jgi:two-component system LytT family response regulator
MTLSMIRVVIVEDQPGIRSDIQYLVEKQEGFSVAGSCGTVKEARTLIQQLKPDLLLLDIHLPDDTGFDVLKETANEYKAIFLTGFENHAIQAIKHGALDYLLKPVDETEFSQALHKVSRNFPARPEQVNVASSFHGEGIRNRLVLRSQDYLQIVEINQIVYCHSDSGYTTFYFDDKRKILVSKILKDYEDVLTEPMFLRPHQSYLVNTGYIDRYTRDGIIHLKNGEQVPVSTRRKEAVLHFFNRL